MTIENYQFTLSNLNVGAQNASIVDFDSDNVSNSQTEREKNIVQFTAYLIASTFCASGTSIQGCKVSVLGGVQGIQEPFPTAAWNAFAAVNTLPAGFAYGTTFGSGTLLPIGTSMCIQEITSTPGRSGRGRHFLPFASVNNLAVTGLWVASARDYIVNHYKKMILDQPNSATITPLAPVVVSKISGGAPRPTPLLSPIVNVQATLVPSNLVSRRR